MGTVCWSSGEHETTGHKTKKNSLNNPTIIVGD